MKRVFIIAALIVLSIMVAGCGKSEVGPEDVSTAIPSPDSTPAHTEIKNTDTPNPTEVTASSKTIDGLEVPALYAGFMEQQGWLAEDQLWFFSNEDWNGDGTKEAVAAFGRSEGDSRELDSIYVLQEVNGKVTTVGEPYGSGSYEAVQVREIALQDRQEPVLELSLTNEIEMNGFALVEFDGNELVMLTSSTAVTGAGEDKLVDADQDGQYDGYTSERWDYDVLYYPVTREFKWQNGGFEPTKTTVDVGDYPDERMKVVKQYAVLRTIDDGLSNEIAGRLKEICPDCTDEQTSFVNADWQQNISQLITTRAEDYLTEIKLDELKKESVIALTYSLDNGTSYKLTFTLVLTDQDRWIITDIQ
ncbi:hypothetical protein [Paenibacillus sp. NPDC058174]|uniref:hypothetical protein n=1 Tax=Paenibacillus sp. NPDC058174 TaxID=3346366 RepID=UPI0036D8C7C4